MKVQTKRLNRNVKPFVKNPVADSLCTPFHTFPSLREKLNESQFSACNSIKSKRPPTHSFVGSGVWHLPSAETNHATVVFFLVDKQVLCGTENLVDSLIAVFTDVGDTFKGSKNFADHIFYGLNLVDCKAHVKSENFTISVRNNFCRLETILDFFFRDTDESGGQTFASVRKIREAIAVYRLKDQFVFHVDTLAVHDDVCNNFLCLFDRIFVEFVKVAPVRLVIHEFVDAPFGIAKGNLQGDEIVDVNFSFNFHALSMRQNSVEVKAILRREY